MGRVIYSVASSLDGYNTDAQGDFSWAMPNEEVIAAVTGDLADVSTYLYGRRMYEAMEGWETDPSIAAQSPESAVFAETWKAADKVVFSSSLTEVRTAHTRLEPELSIAAVERARHEAEGDLTIEGPTLAKSALKLGVVDVIELLLCPVLVGGGTSVFPVGISAGLRLTRHRRFTNGMLQVTYEVDRH
ncbi:dihydrofolate reductase family protein [Arthrobacter castelli]|uniref:dihydrofolate reductase family protein n=1 Tax=Arthrobacter castelli TaxID=271431 RepID=UPI0004235A3B|nr:dihydrofolate reductase family protein [Arthrobacter castelli]